MSPTIPPASMVYSKTEFFNLVMATGLGEGKL